MTGRAESELFGFEFDVRNLVGERWYRDYELQFADHITESSMSDIRDLFGTAFSEGASIGEMERSLDVLFRQWIDDPITDEERERSLFATARLPSPRLEMIARTETMRMSNAGSNALYKKWGAKKKEWIATGDKRTRPTHAAADGQVVDIDDSFSVGGAKLEFPGDPKGPLAETVMCRCAVLPVLGTAADEPVTQQPRPQLYRADDQTRLRSRDIGDRCLKEFASINNMSDAEARQLFEDQLRGDLDNPVAIRASSKSAEQILTEGRFKSQFEVEHSGGFFDREFRAKAEQGGLGMPTMMPPDQRPIYGYARRSTGDLVDNYGNVEFILKDEVKDRATYTVGDSLGQFIQNSAVGVEYGSIDTASTGPRMINYLNNDIEYVEVQIQGHVTVSDIKKIVVHWWSDDTYDQRFGNLEAIARAMNIDIERDIP